ncbi:transketolase-like TK C-terminal-containing protein [Hymenobacter sp. BRD67]|uniref:transketolase-like TK C-terminal-containing protein n=1 Tax=Hymenobacter sp. BRD67 TaxID=2675877 RepID=UPI0020B6A711|nr:hypothetical protein [Hymenobacter sp. BRD67]
MLEQDGTATRVVSMPSWELFEHQDKAYREKVLPPTVRKRVAIEAGTPIGWHKYATDEGAVIAMNRFGASAPAEELFEKFGFTVENVVKRAKGVLAGHPEQEDEKQVVAKGN